MTASTVLNLAFGFLAAWLVGIAGYASAKAAQPRFDPLPPELPEHHGDDHGGAGHAAHGGAGHGAHRAAGDRHGHDPGHGRGHH